ncbi:hypothetical protein [Streptomyces sp. NPDC002845]
MSSMSRRSLLGHSGTAAAGAVLAAGGTASAAQTGAQETTETTKTTVEFTTGTEFTGHINIPDLEAGARFTFTVDATEAPESYRITPLDVLNALNELAASRG